VRICKKFFLDSVGVAMAGSTAPGTAEVMGLTRQWGGRAESTVFAFGDKLPAPEAAFMNGVMIHARDFDDTHDVAIVHADASVLPSAVAVAEQTGIVTGQQLIAAVVIGIDLTCRLGLALKHYKGWHNSAICGGFGAAAAASKILALDEAATVEALGIVYGQTAGNVQCIRDGALTKRMQLGFAAKAGVTSAYYARSGITGTKNTFQGPYGFFHLYDGPPSGDPEEIRHRPDGEYGEHELLSELGTRFESANLSMKPYPNSRAVHPAIAGALAICRAEGIAADQVERVDLAVSDRTYDRVAGPFRMGDGPLQVKAQFSLVYGVAVAICRGSVSLRDFEESGIRDAAVFALMDRIAVTKEPAFHENTPLRVEIVTKRGERYVKLIESLPGSPEHPLDDDAVEAKFRECCGLAVNPPSKRRTEGIIQAITSLDRMRDIREMTELLS
jgi:2-methylcitrate dehydratase PrpD